MLAKGYPIAAGIALDFAGKIDGAHKFLLPVGGRVIDDYRPVTESMMPMFHLPFPVTVVEFKAVEVAESRDRFHVNLMPKRFAVCVEYGDSAVIWPIDYHKDVDLWMPSWVGTVIPYGETVVGQGMALPYSDDLRDSDGTPLKPSGFAIKARQMFLGEIGKEVAARNSPDDLRTAAYVDTIEEVAAVIQMCAALACKNVTTDAIEPSEKLNRARAKRGHLPHFTYHVLVLNEPRAAVSGASTRNSHASPRTHLRRGHIRHLASGDFCWVNSCIVNPSAQGSVNKDYAVAASR